MTFFCRHCRREEPPSLIGRAPDGWLSLGRVWMGAPQGMVKLGLFCSVDCLMEQLPHIQANITRIDTHREQQEAAHARTP